MRRAEEIKKEKDRIEQEMLLEIIARETETLEQKGLLSESISLVDEDSDEQLPEEAESEIDANSAILPNENAVTHIEVFFRCCCVYGKLYLSIDKAHYVGKCPKCKARLTAPASSNAPRFGLRQ